MTLKEFRKLTEGLPDETEIMYLLPGENPMNDAWQINSAVEVSILGQRANRIILTQDKVSFE